MKLSFHPHALQRIGERFGFTDKLVPAVQIVAVGEKTSVGNRFRVHYQGITYVCARETPDQITVITVFPDKTVNNRQRRITKRMSKREVRSWAKRDIRNKRNTRRGPGPQDKGGQDE